MMTSYKIKQLEKKKNKLLKKQLQVKNKKKLLDIFNKKKKEQEYARSLIMPEYNLDFVQKLAEKKVTPLIKQNLIQKKHKFGENKKKVYDYNLALIEITKDICRVNNWTTRKDWIEKKVPINKLFKDLYKSSIEYSDILRYYAKNRFDDRQKNMESY